MVDRKYDGWVSDAEDMLHDIAEVDERLRGQMTSWRRSDVLHMHKLGFEPQWIAENYGLDLDLGEVVAIIEVGEQR